MSVLNDKEIESILKNAKATLSFEGMDIEDEMVELARRYLKGEIPEKEVLDILKTKLY